MIELVMVIAIIGIIGAITVPKTGSLFRTVQLKAARVKILDDLRFLQNYAVTHHDTTWIEFDVNNNSYAFYHGPSVNNRQLFKDPATNHDAVVNIGDEYTSVYLSQVNLGGQSGFYFDWRGTPSTDGNIILNQSRVVHILPATGYVYESNSLDTPPLP